MELLIAVSITAIIGSTVAALFSKGVDIWEDVRVRSPLEYNAVLFLEEVEKELKNCLDFSEIQFSGESETISFSALIKNRIGCVKYAFNKDKRVIYKYIAPYPDCADEKRFTSYKILDSVKSLSFEYGAPEEGRLNWTDLQQKEKGLPRAVRIKIEVAPDEELNEGCKFEKVVHIPIA